VIYDTDTLHEDKCAFKRQFLYNYKQHKISRPTLHVSSSLALLQ